MLSEIFLDVKGLLAVAALQTWCLVVDGMRLEVPEGVEDFAAFLAGNLLFRSVVIVDVIFESRIRVEALVTVWTLVLPFAVMDVANVAFQRFTKCVGFSAVALMRSEVGVLVGLVSLQTHGGGED